MRREARRSAEDARRVRGLWESRRRVWVAQVALGGRERRRQWHHGGDEQRLVAAAAAAAATSGGSWATSSPVRGGTETRR